MLSANFSAMVELGDDVLKPFLQVWWRGGGGGREDKGGGWVGGGALGWGGEVILGGRGPACLWGCSCGVCWQRDSSNCNIATSPLRHQCTDRMSVPAHHQLCTGADT
jgi:hypothetical protein